MATEADVPVIVMSGYLTVRDEIKPLGLRYLRKPFSLAEMLDLVATRSRRFTLRC